MTALAFFSFFIFSKTLFALFSVWKKIKFFTYLKPFFVELGNIQIPNNFFGAEKKKQFWTKLLDAKSIFLEAVWPGQAWYLTKCDDPLNPKCEKYFKKNGQTNRCKNNYTDAAPSLGTQCQEGQIKWSKGEDG